MLNESIKEPLQETLATAAELVQEMTLDEKAGLLAGVDDWHFRGVERLGVPGLKVADCGHGVTLVGEDASASTCFPTGIGMASTWNAELLYEAGVVLGMECRSLGCSILLGPKINIHRIPLNGRSFETFSEDPVLAGVLGSAVIQGVQSVGVGACVKAMAANNQQFEQYKVSSEVGERALREIYFRAFEIAVKTARPCSIMTSYNRLNGDFAAESRWMITDVIKEEWKFPGLVVSDWRSVKTEKVYASGLDLEMPGPGTYFKRSAVLRAIDEGLLTEEQVDDKARRIVSVLLKYGHACEAPGALDTPEHRAIALRIAEECMVLLKNEDGLLPLSKKTTRRILVTGPNAMDARLGGGGSASVTPFYSVSPLQGIQEICGEEVEVEYLEGCSITGTMATMSGCFQHRDESGEIAEGLLTEFFNGMEPEGDSTGRFQTRRLDYSWGWAAPNSTVRRGSFAVRFSGEIVPPATGKYRIGVYAQQGCVRLKVGDEVVVERWVRAGEGDFESAYVNHFETFEVELEAGKPVPVVLEYAKRVARAAVRMEWEIPGTKSSIELAVEAAQRADVVVVCAGLSNVLEGGAQDRTDMEIPSVQRVLIEAVSKVNPKTIVVLNNGGAVTVPWLDHAAALIEAWYPGQEGGRALARILFGEVNPSGKLPDTIPVKLEDHASARNYPGNGDCVNYEEGVFVGYRHFDTAEIEPRFPFGFGLSYTTFEITAPVLKRKRFAVGETIDLQVEVTNTGNRTGKEVVQIYVSSPVGKIPRPKKELRAFKKVELAPKETRIIGFTLTKRDFEYFDEEAGSWIFDAGKYEILTGGDSCSLGSAQIQIG